MVKHIDRWFAFVQDLELGIDQMEEIVLVTGCDRTRSWTNVAFLESGTDSLVSFRVNVIRDRIDWHVSPEHIRGAVLNRGPSGEVCKFCISKVCESKPALACFRVS
jgi:hypothetical protein